MGKHVGRQRRAIRLQGPRWVGRKFKKKTRVDWRRDLRKETQSSKGEAIINKKRRDRRSLLIAAPRPVSQVNQSISQVNQSSQSVSQSVSQVKSSQVSQPRLVRQPA